MACNCKCLYGPHAFLCIAFLFTQHSQLGNSFGTHPNWINLTKWNFYTLFHNNINSHANQKNCPISIFKFSIKNDFSTLTVAPPKNQVELFKNQESSAATQTPKQQTTFSDMEPFLHPYPIISTLINLNYLTQRTPKFKVRKILPGTLPNPNWTKETKRPQIDHLDHEIGVHILFIDPASRCFDLGCFFQMSLKLCNPPQITQKVQIWRGGKFGTCLDKLVHISQKVQIFGERSILMKCCLLYGCLNDSIQVFIFKIFYDVF